ncbi:MAG: PIN domain-containing protein [Myxococcaceae bacterium]
MIFPDTSVWVAAFRRRDSTEAMRLATLMDESHVALSTPVRVEILSGCSSRELPRMQRLLSSFPLFAPSQDTWGLLERWLSKTTAAGERFGLVDLLIAAIAAERGGLVWSLDSAFARLAKLRLVKPYRF